MWYCFHLLNVQLRDKLGEVRMSEILILSTFDKRPIMDGEIMA